MGLTMDKLMRIQWATWVQDKVGQPVLYVGSCGKNEFGLWLAWKCTTGLNMGGDDVMCCVAEFGIWHWHGPSPPLGVHGPRLSIRQFTWAVRLVCMACGELKHVHRWQQHGREITKQLHVKNNLVDAIAMWKGSKESKQLYYCLKFVQQVQRGKQSVLWQFSHSILKAAEGENSVCYVGKQCILCVCMSL